MKRFLLSATLRYKYLLGEPSADLAQIARAMKQTAELAIKDLQQEQRRETKLV